MAGIGQYLKETRAELRHVAWPTQTQTIVYTVLVAAISIGVAVYLGLFDFIFTTGLTRLISAMPQGASAPATLPVSSTGNTTGSSNAPLIQGAPIQIVPTAPSTNSSQGGSTNTK